ncbi:MAG TPA: NAD(P)/FAD-dependent oxidoreductase [Gemmatimonadaceae bacterium]|nr:NAD(P)/FAD-dependent oxidoreductase [Gemmatimonadaceae bacterium]
MPTAAYDVVILGSEPSALTAAAYLAKAGRRVLLLERREDLGGAVVTEELLAGCRVDAVFDDIGWLPRSIVSELELRRHGLELVQLDPMVTAPAKHGGHLALWRQLGRTQDSIRALSTRDAERWPDFATGMAKHAALLESLYEAPAPRPGAGGMPTSDDLRGLLRLGRRAGLRGRADLLELARVVPMSIAELLDDWFESDTLKGALAGGAIGGLMQGPRSGGTAFLFLHRHVGGESGAVRARQTARGGAGRLADALAAAAREAGAEIRCGACVDRVRVQGGRATGVVLGNGDEIAARAVLSGKDPRTTMLDLVEPLHLDPDAARAARQIRFRGPMARVHLAVDELPRFRGIGGDGLLGGSVVIAPSLDHLERAYDDAKYGRVSERPYLEIAIPTFADPSRAPAATHIVSVTMQYAPYTLREGEWTPERRSALGDLVVGALAEYAPALRETVIERCVLTPRDLEQRYGLREGSPDQGEMMLDQILFMRPMPGWSRHATPIHGLWLCGSGTHPGGRIAGVSGRLAAREILRAKH